ncbi:MAG: hypothetical protein AAGE84_00910 [Cyanobacteria bacterium P01_G01_bin.39]
MSNICISSLESITELNEQEISIVIGGRGKKSKKGYKPVKIKVAVFKDIDQTNQQSSVNQANNNVGSGDADNTNEDSSNFIG